MSSRDPLRPQFTDHCFTGEYPTPLTDRRRRPHPAAIVAAGRGELNSGAMSAPASKPRPYVALLPGDPAPWFYQRSLANPHYAFSSVGGRYVVMCFYGSAADPLGRAALDAVIASRAIFDDTNICFFGVSADPGDAAEDRIKEMLPGIRYFLDYDLAVARLCGAAPKDIADGEGQVPLRRFWLVLDPTLRVKAVFPCAGEAGGFGEVLCYLKSLPPPAQFAGFEVQAPILILPNVFEPDCCTHLIELYEQHGGEESGFMREVNGKTVTAHDHSHKRRKDYIIDDKALIAETQRRIQRRIVPEIQKVHQFKVTRMERYIVSCYSAEDLSHFRAHRDNTTAGTAHRRFAGIDQPECRVRGRRNQLPGIRAAPLQAAGRRRLRVFVLTFA